MSTRTARDYVRGYRIRTGKTETLHIPAEIIGLLLRDGGETTRAILAIRFPPLILDACYSLAVQGVSAGQGKGNRLLTVERPGRRPQRHRHSIDPDLIEAVLAGAPAVGLTAAERHVLVHRMAGLHMYDTEISTRLNLSMSHTSALRRKPLRPYEIARTDDDITSGYGRQ